MPTRSDALAEIHDILSAGGVNLPSDYDLDGIVADCHRACGSFSLSDVPDAEFWEIVSARQLPSKL